MQPDLMHDSAVVAIQPEVGKLTDFARTLVVKTAEQYNAAAGYLKTIKGLLGKIEEARTRVTRPLLEAQREVNAQAKDASAPLQAAESQIKRALVAYSNEQERLRREEQARAEEAARKERERIEAQAAKAAAAGKIERAEQLEERAATVVAPVIQREAPKVSGVSMREVWKFEIVDPSKINAAFLMPDEKKIGAQVRALKSDAAAIIGPGVRVYMEKQLAAGVA